MVQTVQNSAVFVLFLDKVVRCPSWFNDRWRGPDSAGHRLEVPRSQSSILKSQFIKQGGRRSCSHAATQEYKLYLYGLPLVVRKASFVCLCPWLAVLLLFMRKSTSGISSGFV